MATFGQQPRQLTFDVISEAWQVLQKNMAVYVVGTLILLVGAGGINFVNELFWRLAFNIDTRNISSMAELTALISSPFYYASMVSNALVGALIGPLSLSISYAALKQMRGEAVTLATLFEFDGKYIQLVGFFVLYYTVINIGLMLCCIPGIIVSVLWFPAGFMIRDRGIPLTEAIRLSSNGIMPFLGVAIGLQIVGCLIAISGICALCVGVFVTMAFFYVLQACMYRAIFEDSAPVQTYPGWQ